MLKILRAEPSIEGEHLLQLSTSTEVARMYQNITVRYVKLKVVAQRMSVTHADNPDPKKEVI
mgnify:CR=1 FL=1